MLGKTRIEAKIPPTAFYVARDSDGMVWLYEGVPVKDDHTWHGEYNKSHAICGWHDEDKKAFPNVSWDDELPTKVRVEVVI